MKNENNAVMIANIADKEENYRDKFFKAREAIGDSSVDLEKARTLLEHWLQEYDFRTAPDPIEAIKWGQSKGTREKQQANSAKWYMEYNLIFKLVDIAFDYILKTQEILEKEIEV